MSPIEIGVIIGASVIVIATVVYNVIQKKNGKSSCDCGSSKSMGGCSGNCSKCKGDCKQEDDKSSK